MVVLPRNIVYEGLGVRGDGSLGYWSQETIHFFSHHHNDDCISDYYSLETSVGDGRGGFRYQETIQYSPGNFEFYCCGDQSGDGGRSGLRSQNTIHSYFINCGANVDCDGRGGYMSHTSHSPSHNIGGDGRFLGCSIYSCPVHESVHGDERGGHRSQTSHLLSHNHGEQCIAPTGSPQYDFPWCGGGEMIQKFMKAVDFIHIKITLIILIQACHHAQRFCPYCTSPPIYAPYIVAQHQNIPSFGYSYFQPHSCVLYSIPLNLLHHVFRPYSSWSMTDNRSTRRNHQ